MRVGKIWFGAKEALKFYFNAETVHDIDSPFLYALLMNTLEKRKSENFIQKIVELKKQLLASNEKFTRTDLGQGSTKKKYNQHEVTLGKWVKISSIDYYYGELLFNLCAHIKPNQLLELGTAAGISAAYLASGSPSSQLISLEADPYLCQLATQNMASLGLKNTTIKEGDFADTLRSTLIEVKNVDLAFIDGHHQSKALFDQLELIYPSLTNFQVIIIDDIRWSADMYQAWQNLLKDDRWNVSLDFYRMGVLIFNADIKHRINKMVIASKWKSWSLGLFR